MSPSAKFKTAPIITTERLILRPHKYDDFDQYLAMFQEPAFTRYTTVEPLSREDTWTKMIRHGGHWSFLGYGYWAIEEKSSGNFIGEMGFADFKRTLTPSLEGMMEAGWGLVTAAHGKGYASEALKVALDWRDDFYPEKETACIIAPENAASIRLAEKHGFSLWVETMYKIYETKMFRRI